MVEACRHPGRFGSSDPASPLSDGSRRCNGSGTHAEGTAPAGENIDVTVRRPGRSPHPIPSAPDHHDLLPGRRRPHRGEVLAREVALVTLVGVAFTSLSAALPAPQPDTMVALTLLLGVAGASGVTLWVRASTLGLLRICGLSVVSAASCAAGATLAVSRPTQPGPVLSLGHLQWVGAIALILSGSLIAHRIIGVLASRLRQLDDLARIDPLTGLANRRWWDEEIRRELARAHRDGTSTCVAILDLDHFKAYNDMRGHQEGDQLLTRVGAGWLAAVRESDFIARYGGEEFGLILRGCGLAEAMPVVERVRTAIGDGLTCSAGLAQWNRHESADELVHRADGALYRAKDAGRDRIKVSLPEEVERSRASIDADWPEVIHRLLENRSVVAAYQPVVRLSDAGIVAYEALARPDRNKVDISVENMFSSAQRIGLGRDLDWLCRRAAIAGSAWMPPGMPLFVNCNLSGLIDPVHRVDQMLLVVHALGREPTDIVLEITERELFGDLRRLREVVNTYRTCGFRFAVDDVGEGHSTLEVLSVCEPEFVKVARSLVVESVNRGPRGAIRAVVAFAGEVGAHVIAEGIETAQAADRMASLGVTLGQGWFFGRPQIPAEELPAAVSAAPVLVAATASAPQAVPAR